MDHEYGTHVYVGDDNVTYAIHNIPFNTVNGKPTMRTSVADQVYAILKWMQRTKTFSTNFHFNVVEDGYGAPDDDRR